MGNCKGKAQKCGDGRRHAASSIARSLLLLGFVTLHGQRIRAGLLRRRGGDDRGEGPVAVGSEIDAGAADFSGSQRSTLNEALVEPIGERQPDLELFALEIDGVDGAAGKLQRMDLPVFALA